MLQTRPASSRRPPQASTPAFVWLFRIVFYGSLALAFALGGTLTQVAAVVAAIFAFIGDLDGGFRHALRLAALGATATLAPPFGRQAGAWIAGQWAIPFAVANVLGIAIVGLVVILTLGCIGKYGAGLIRRRRALGGIDRVAGGLLGGGEGVLLAVLVFWVLTTFQTPLVSMRARLHAGGHDAHAAMLARLDDWRAAAAADPIGRFAAHSNLLKDVPVIRTMHGMAELLADPQLIERAIDDPRLRALTDTPAVQKYVQALQQDADIRAAVEQRNWAALLSHPLFHEMLNDQELYATFAAHADDLNDVLTGAPGQKYFKVAEGP